MITAPEEYYKGLPRKTIAACVLIPHNDFYLIIRKRSTQQWTLPGGIVESGESPMAGAIRECQEETGIRPSIEGLYHVYYSEPVIGEKISYGDSIHLIFKAKPITADQLDQICFPDQEADKYQWVALDEVASFVKSNLGKAILSASCGELYSVWKRTLHSLMKEDEFYQPKNDYQ
ncbi:NUDIX hydrolase [Mucilaginibacter daejeonensis]|uniref:NUDIX domain-containing protein n=1 Tax=Mucilaginibacter daejeonensis TaxID=398049 RepID=UPI001D1708EE|nr:NUDIX hydrolase [Mucilaginibacter daejeonensis]UEG51860.1 NUDIX hydrolase [Mucilaginibacter daejeonensis]